MTKLAAFAGMVSLGFAATASPAQTCATNLPMGPPAPACATCVPKQAAAPCAQPSCREDKTIVYHHCCPTSPSGEPRDATPRSSPAPQEAGMFVNPPPTGTVEGAESGWRLRGLSLTLPEMKFALPTIELPCFSRTARAPRMRIDPAYAGYADARTAQLATPAVRQQTARVAVVPQQARQQRSASRSTPRDETPRSTCGCGDTASSTEDLRQRLDALDGQRRELQEQMMLMNKALHRLLDAQNAQTACAIPDPRCGQTESLPAWASPQRVPTRLPPASETLPCPAK
ncbi:MAG: hypothetical protein AAF266_04670 [Planctomycetota bacterium]